MYSAVCYSEGDHLVVNKLENEFALDFAVTAIMYLKELWYVGLETKGRELSTIWDI